MKCVAVMATVYFVVYFLLWFTITCKELRLPMAANRAMSNLSNFLDKRAKEACEFMPMLCILFLGTFMRALQITNGKGAPQRWAQRYMYVGTMAVVVMIVARLDELVLYPPGEEGAANSAKASKPRVMGFFFILQHLCSLLMHVAVVAVIIALFTMTPQTATGVGSIANLSASSSI